MSSVGSHVTTPRNVPAQNWEASPGESPSRSPRPAKPVGSGVKAMAAMFEIASTSPPSKDPTAFHGIILPTPMQQQMVVGWADTDASRPSGVLSQYTVNASPTKKSPAKSGTPRSAVVRSDSTQSDNNSWITAIRHGDDDSRGLGEENGGCDEPQIKGHAPVRRLGSDDERYHGGRQEAGDENKASTAVVPQSTHPVLEHKPGVSAMTPHWGQQQRYRDNSSSSRRLARRQVSFSQTETDSYSTAKNPHAQRSSRTPSPNSDHDHAAAVASATAITTPGTAAPPSALPPDRDSTISTATDEAAADGSPAPGTGRGSTGTSNSHSSPDKSKSSKTPALHAQIRTLQKQLEARAEEAQQLRRLVDAKHDAEPVVVALREQLRRAERECRTWRERAEAAEKRVAMFERLAAAARARMARRGSSGGLDRHERGMSVGGGAAATAGMNAGDAAADDYEDDYDDGDDMGCEDGGDTSADGEVEVDVEPLSEALPGNHQQRSDNKGYCDVQAGEKIKKRRLQTQQLLLKKKNEIKRSGGASRPLMLRSGPAARRRKQLPAAAARSLSLSSAGGHTEDDDVVAHRIRMSFRRKAAAHHPGGDDAGADGDDEQGDDADADADGDGDGGGDVDRGDVGLSGGHEQHQQQHASRGICDDVGRCRSSTSDGGGRLSAAAASMWMAAAEALLEGDEK
ncbi:hypothetical protein B0T26DRAFT_748523 [Lasiosphaeria miniovina]|uniref:Uncharacterized protein n=1 Tax=Lasiosphaeria miniovina TaxID=1954250 RepID=A0AA40B671_9PEZI|nr:uncharacterized protein B0T26DRAFT_748523 [Lasiosphaeria miniovina]KAK0728282.1 hypothetical protein B0T26DRAFT_748523 [Lasiosphaeria miniovina]